MTYLTAETFLFSGVVRSKYGRKCRVIAKEAGFRGHHELFSAIIFDKIHSERRWRPLGKNRRWMPEKDDIVADVRKRCIVVGVGVHWEKTEGGCQKRTTSSLMYVSDAS